MQTQPTTDVHPVFISTSILPGALFAGPAALAEFGQERAAYTAAVRQYEMDGDEVTLWIDLTDLGYSPAEIAWHVAHPGEFDRTGFVS